MLQVLVADDHKLFRKSIVGLVDASNLPARIHEACDGADTLQLLTSYAVDLLILDIQMPVVTGAQVLRRMRELKLSTRVIAISERDEDSLLAYIFQIGVNGLWFKWSEPVELAEAIESVVSKGIYYNDGFIRGLKLRAEYSSKHPGLNISPREYQLIDLLNDGNSNKDMARALGLTVRTVESYRKALMKKTHTRTAAELVRFAYGTGLMA